MSGQDVMKNIRGKMYEKGFKEGMLFGFFSTALFLLSLFVLLKGTK